jgi:hypothetical protein
MTMIDVIDGDLAVGEDILVTAKTGGSGRVMSVEKQTYVLPNPHAIRPERPARDGGATTTPRQQCRQRDRGNQLPHRTKS